MTAKKKLVLIVLLVFNAIVLMGQLWPEGTPPFARVVNVATLAGNLIFFISLLRKPVP